MSTSIVRHCQCGDTLRVQSSSVTDAIDLDSRFSEYHSGDGHGPATAEEAAAVRREQRAADLQGGVPGGQP